MSTVQDRLDEIAFRSELPIHDHLLKFRRLADIQDIRDRSIHASIVHGAYAQPSSIVVVVNGSPPVATLFIDAYSLSGYVRAWIFGPHGTPHAIRAVEELNAVYELARDLLDDALTGHESWFPPQPGGAS